ncbi:MAG: hypothetical protein GQ477_01085 [Nanohaloarchaea archaeon]|nr:hypothetical protein [Candidatus Nanohaloarchaea archaeon]
MDRKIKMCLYVCLTLATVVMYTQAYAVNLPTTIWMVAPDIELDLRLANIIQGDNQTIEISIYNPNDYSALGNLSVKVGRQTLAGPYEYLTENVIEEQSILAMGANNTQYLVYNWSSVGSINGTYKVYLRFDYNGTYTTRYTTFEITAYDETNTTETIDETTPDDGGQGGEERLEIISINDNLDFGAISTIGVRYQSGPKTHGKLRIIGYVSGPKKISQDLYGKTIYRNFCKVNTGVEIRNVWSDGLFYLNIPLLLKDNCDDGYLPGNYSVTVRACRYGDDGWEYYSDPDLKKTIDIWINKNEMCVDMIASLETDTCSSTSGSLSNYLDIQGYDQKSKSDPALNVIKNKIYEVIEFDETVYVGDVFQTQIAIFNNLSAIQNVTIYSYAYDNTTLISDGLNDSLWSHNWNANKMSFEVLPYSNYSVVLFNKIENVSSGLYRFRARMFYSGRKYDISRWISVHSREDHDILSVECNMFGSLGQMTITNKDSADIGIEYYVIDGTKMDFYDFKLKKNRLKTVKFSFFSDNVSILVIGGGRDLYKCYISRELVNISENLTQPAAVTGYVTRDYDVREERGLIAWILRFFGRGR